MGPFDGSTCLGNGAREGRLRHTNPCAWIYSWTKSEFSCGGVPREIGFQKVEVVAMRTYTLTVRVARGYSIAQWQSSMYFSIRRARSLRCSKRRIASVMTVSFDLSHGSDLLCSVVIAESALKISCWSSDGRFCPRDGGCGEFGEKRNC